MSHGVGDAAVVNHQYGDVDRSDATVALGADGNGRRAFHILVGEGDDLAIDGDVDQVGERSGGFIFIERLGEVALLHRDVDASIDAVGVGYQFREVEHGGCVVLDDQVQARGEFAELRCILIGEDRHGGEPVVVLELD